MQSYEAFCEDLKDSRTLEAIWRRVSAGEDVEGSLLERFVARVGSLIQREEHRKTPPTHPTMSEFEKAVTQQFAKASDPVEQGKAAWLHKEAPVAQLFQEGIGPVAEKTVLDAVPPSVPDNSTAMTPPERPVTKLAGTFQANPVKPALVLKNAPQRVLDEEHVKSPLSAVEAPAPEAPAPEAVASEEGDKDVFVPAVADPVKGLPVIETVIETTATKKTAEASRLAVLGLLKDKPSVRTRVLFDSLYPEAESEGKTAKNNKYSTLSYILKTLLDRGEIQKVVTEGIRDVAWALAGDTVPEVEVAKVEEPVRADDHPPLHRDGPVQDYVLWALESGPKTHSEVTRYIIQYLAEKPKTSDEARVLVSWTYSVLVAMDKTCSIRRINRTDDPTSRILWEIRQEGREALARIQAK